MRICFARCPTVALGPFPSPPFKTALPPSQETQLSALSKSMCQAACLQQQAAAALTVTSSEIAAIRTCARRTRSTAAHAASIDLPSKHATAAAIAHTHTHYWWCAYAVSRILCCNSCTTTAALLLLLLTWQLTSAK
eukprot:14029-Heterococcus_DN1.PRE.4